MRTFALISAIIIMAGTALICASCIVLDFMNSSNAAGVKVELGAFQVRISQSLTGFDETAVTDIDCKATFNITSPSCGTLIFSLLG